MMTVQNTGAALRAKLTAVKMWIEPRLIR